jgi:hypothetical protein
MYMIIRYGLILYIAMRFARESNVNVLLTSSLIPNSLIRPLNFSFPTYEGDYRTYFVISPNVRTVPSLASQKLYQRAHPAL